MDCSGHAGSVRRRPSLWRALWSLHRHTGGCIVNNLSPGKFFPRICGKTEKGSWEKGGSKRVGPQAIHCNWRHPKPNLHTRHHEHHGSLRRLSTKTFNCNEKMRNRKNPSSEALQTRGHQRAPHHVDCCYASQFLMEPTVVTLGARWSEVAASEGCVATGRHASCVTPPRTRPRVGARRGVVSNRTQRRRRRRRVARRLRRRCPR